MIDEYMISSYYDSGDGRLLWDNHQYDGRGYGFPRSDRGNRTSLHDEDWAGRAEVDPKTFARALLGFVVALILYFCALCYFCDQRRDSTKKEVDRSIVTKAS